VSLFSCAALLGHLDVAGVAFGDDEFAKSKHATAYGVHLLTKFIENLCL
jgi:leucyl aminopeptidase